MGANFTSVVLDNGLLPIASTIRKRLSLHPGDQVRISIEVLHRAQRRASQARYAELLSEKDTRVLTPKEQAELIALANGEFDAAVARARKIARKTRPDLFDEQGSLHRQKTLASLH